VSVTDELLENAQSYAASFDKMLTFTDDDFKRSVQEETGIKPEWAAEAFPDLDEDVRQSIARIQASPFIPRKNVRGFVYHVEDGQLNEVG
jgi:carbonic anhydrase